MKTALLALTFALAGCATAAKPGITPAPDGTYKAMRRAAQFWDPTGPLRVQAQQDASDYCAARSQRAIVLDAREIPAIDHWPEAVVSFRCE